MLLSYCRILRKNKSIMSKTPCSFIDHQRITSVHPENTHWHTAFSSKACYRLHGRDKYINWQCHNCCNRDELGVPWTCRKANVTYLGLEQEEDIIGGQQNLRVCLGQFKRGIRTYYENSVHWVLLGYLTQLGGSGMGKGKGASLGAVEIKSTPKSAWQQGRGEGGACRK